MSSILFTSLVTFALCLLAAEPIQACLMNVAEMQQAVEQEQQAGPSSGGAPAPLPAFMFGAQHTAQPPTPVLGPGPLPGAASEITQGQTADLQPATLPSAAPHAHAHLHQNRATEASKADSSAECEAGSDEGVQRETPPRSDATSMLGGAGVLFMQHDPLPPSPAVLRPTDGASLNLGPEEEILLGDAALESREWDTEQAAQLFNMFFPDDADSDYELEEEVGDDERMAAMGLLAAQAGLFCLFLRSLDSSSIAEAQVGIGHGKLRSVSLDAMICLH